MADDEVLVERNGRVATAGYGGRDQRLRDQRL